MKQSRPDLTIVLNGGLGTLDEALPHLGTLDGVMLGRAAYQTPWVLSDVDAQVFGAPPSAMTRAEVIHAMADYAADRMAEGTPLKSITRHMLGLFQGVPGASVASAPIGERTPAGCFPKSCSTRSASSTDPKPKQREPMTAEQSEASQSAVRSARMGLNSGRSSRSSQRTMSGDCSLARRC